MQKEWTLDDCLAANEALDFSLDAQAAARPPVPGSPQ
jgi:hypothetical protein